MDEQDEKNHIETGMFPIASSSEDDTSKIAVEGSICVALLSIATAALSLLILKNK